MRMWFLGVCVAGLVGCSKRESAQAIEPIPDDVVGFDARRCERGFRRSKMMQFGRVRVIVKGPEGDQCVVELSEEGEGGMEGIEECRVARSLGVVMVKPYTPDVPPVPGTCREATHDDGLDQ
jgi:hypothetical protein